MVGVELPAMNNGINGTLPTRVQPKIFQDSFFAALRTNIMFEWDFSDVGIVMLG